MISASFCGTMRPTAHNAGRRGKECRNCQQLRQYRRLERTFGGFPPCTSGTRAAVARGATATVYAEVRDLEDSERTSAWTRPRPCRVSPGLQTDAGRTGQT